MSLHNGRQMEQQSINQKLVKEALYCSNNI